ncbi:hypothetical protein CHUAL_009836 [Chamberlinius hualienensis]
MELCGKGIITISDVENVVKSFQDLLIEKLKSVGKDSRTAITGNPYFAAEAVKKIRHDSQFRSVIVDAFIEISETNIKGRVEETSVMKDITDLVMDICEMTPPYTQAHVKKVERLFQLWKSITVQLKSTENSSTEASQYKKKKKRNKKKKKENVESQPAQSPSVEAARNAANDLIDRVIEGIKQFSEVKVFLNEYSLKEPLKMTTQNELLQIANEVLESNRLGMANVDKVEELKILMKELGGDIHESENVGAVNKEEIQCERVRKNSKNSDSRNKKHLTPKRRPVKDSKVSRPSLTSVSEEQERNRCVLNSGIRSSTQFDVAVGSILNHSEQMPQPEPLSEERKRRIEEKEREVEQLRCLVLFLNRFSMQCQNTTTSEVVSAHAINEESNLE